LQPPSGPIAGRRWAALATRFAGESGKPREPSAEELIYGFAGNLRINQKGRVNDFVLSVSRRYKSVGVFIKAKRVYAD